MREHRPVAAQFTACAASYRLPRGPHSPPHILLRLTPSYPPPRPALPLLRATIRPAICGLHLFHHPRLLRHSDL